MDMYRTGSHLRFGTCLGDLPPNAKYGEWGLMKMQAAKNHPRYIINRKRFLRLIIPNLKNRKS